MDALHILSGLYKSLLTVISDLIKNCSCPPTIHRPFMGDFLPKVPIQPRMDPMPVQSRILYLKWSKKSYALDWCWEKRVSWERTTQMTLFYGKDCSHAQKRLSIRYLPFQKSFVYHQWHESEDKVCDEKGKVDVVEAKHCIYFYH